MFVLLGKMLGPLASPLGLCFLVWIGAVVGYFRGARVFARGATLVGVILVLVFSNLQVGSRLLFALEDDFVALLPDEAPAGGAIVVLGGFVRPSVLPRIETDVSESFDRLLYGMRLWRSGKAPLLILSGGNIPYLSGSEISEARQMRDLALEFGIPDSVIVLEERSRNTYENAVFTAELLDKRRLKRILLVTSAAHMRRAMAVFDGRGFEIAPLPTDLQITPKPFSLHHVLPSINGLNFSTIALREYVGLQIYRLKGWIL